MSTALAVELVMAMVMEVHPVGVSIVAVIAVHLMRLHVVGCYFLAAVVVTTSLIL